MRQPFKKIDEIKIKGVNRSFKVWSRKGQKAGAGFKKTALQEPPGSLVSPKDLNIFFRELTTCARLRSVSDG